MSIRRAADLTVIELKEKLRTLGLPYTGNKNELIVRLNETDSSGTWIENAAVQEARGMEDVSVPEAQARSNEREHLFPERYLREKHQMETELDHLRREIELLKASSREDGGSRAPNSHINVASSVTQPRINITSIAELLATYNGTEGDFEIWEKQLRLLKRTYQLDNEHAKVLVGMRLRGKALEWLHSKPELIEMSVEALLIELKSMFHHRPSRIMLRKTFEERKWKEGETFSDYVHEKIILGNRVPIEEDEIVEYIVDGIPDLNLRNQARISGLWSKESLLRAFEGVTMADRKHPETRSGESKQRMQRTNRSNGDGRSEQHKTYTGKKNCFNCGQPNHYSKDCPTKENGPKCFKCSEQGHIAVRCPKKDDVKERPIKDSCAATQVCQSKCVKKVSVNGREIIALIDTGSDLCLMRADQYIRLGSPTLEYKETRFRGVGLNENATLGEFLAELTIDGHSYPVLIRVVSDNLMTHEMLIGTDFLNTVELNMKNGNVSICPVKEIAVNNNELPEIFQIDVESEQNNKIDLTHVSESEHRIAIKDIVSNYRPCKTKETNVKMTIILKDEEPVYQRARRLSLLEKEKVNEHVNEWLRDGIVQPSLSDYASPVVLVEKKDGSTRLCVDYRQLNRKIVHDRYPLPLIEDQLDLLQDAKFFSILDLKNGFFHVPVDENSRKYTAFIIPDGHYEFLKVPFGLCNSPSIFQRFINATFRDAIRDKIVLTYLDDLIIPSTDENIGIKNLERILRMASEAGLIINWRKCSFLKNRVEFLGHVIENGRIYPSSCKIEAVRKFPEPDSVKRVQSFLGLSGYFRKFVPEYSTIARPLSNLLKSNAKFQFEELEKKAFLCLKEILCDEPVLHLYKPGSETELHTDASIDGYGAILLQKNDEDNKFHPIYYSSGKTSSAERRYTSYELEVLSIVKALVKFRVYLLGISFKIVTDCRAFQLTMHKKDLCVRVARWALLLEEFNYVIEHRPGKNMAHVDALSRNPLPICMITDRCDSLTSKFNKAQQEDSDVKKIFDATNKGNLDGYEIRNGILFKKYNGDVLLVVPASMRTQVIKQAHEKGHFSVAKTESTLLKNFWMPNVRPKIEKIIKNCVACILAERKQGRQEGYLNALEKGELPLDSYHIDHLGPLPSTKKNYKYIFAIVDAFTKFIWLYATKTTNTAEVVCKLRKQSTVFGNPRRIISDRGTAFTSKEFADFCAEENIHHVLTTTGVPRANGQIERVNRVLIPLLTKLSDPKREEWFKFIDLAQLYLNCTLHRAIGTTPFHLLFGTHARMRDDLQIRELLEKEWTIEYQNDRDELRRQAKENIAKIQRENRATYNNKRKPATKYKENDLVAIKRTQLGPGLKLANKYLGPYSVIKVLRHDRYLVQKVNGGEGPLRTSTSADYMKPWVDYASDNSENEYASDNSEEECESDDIRGRVSYQNGRL